MNRMSEMHSPTLPRWRVRGGRGSEAGVSRQSAQEGPIRTETLAGTHRTRG